MFAQWVVAISLRATYNGSAAFNRMSADALRAEAGYTRLQQKMDAVNTIHQTAGMAAAGLGAALLDFSKNGTAAAGEYQTALIQLQQSAGTTADKMAQIRDVINKTTAGTGQNLLQSTNQFTAMLQHGLTVQQMLAKSTNGESLFELVAKYAHLQSLDPMHPTDPVESSANMVMVAHQLGAFDPDSMKSIIEQIAKLQLASGAIQSQIITQGGYFAKLGRQAGMSPEQILDMEERMAQAGLLRGKGGAGMADLILGALNAPSGSKFMDSKKGEAAIELGMYDKKGKSKIIDSKGDLNWAKLHDILAYDLKNMPNNILAGDLKAFGGIPGLRVAMQAFGPAAEQQHRLLEQKKAKEPGIDERQTALLNSWAGAMQVLGTNLETFSINFWLPFITTFTPTLTGLGHAVAALSDFTAGHPGAALGLSIAAVYTGASAIAYGTKSLIGSFFDVGTALRTLARSAEIDAAEMRLAAGAGVVPVVGGAVVKKGEVVAARGVGARAVAGSIGTVIADALSFGLWSPIRAAFASGLAGLGGFVSGLGEVALVVTRFAGPIGLAVGALTLLYEAAMHPISFGKMVADIQEFFFTTMPAAVMRGWNGIVGDVSHFLSTKGSDLVTAPFHGLINIIAAYIVTTAVMVAKVVQDLQNPLTWGKVAGDISQGSSARDALQRQFNAAFLAQQHDNDLANQARQQAYAAERARLNAHHGRVAGTNAQGYAFAQHNHIEVHVDGSTVADQTALAKIISDKVQADLEKSGTRAQRANGGLLGNPFLPALPATS